MRITLPTLDTSIVKVREMLDKANTAPTMAEGAYFMRLARNASRKAR